MNGKIININTVKAHIAGKAKCLSCKHKWVAVIEKQPLNNWLECPNCQLHFGRFVHHYQHQPDEKIWKCNCENELFYVNQDGIYCPVCGVFQNF